MIRSAALLAALLLLWASPPAARAADDDPKLRSPEVQELVEKARAGEELSEEERRTVLESMWRWPEGRGEARALVADDAECRARVAKDPKLEDAHPLQIFMHRARCMEALGWVQRETKD